jgi:hypothetical protein
VVIAIPYMKLLSQGDEVFIQALIWGSVVGTMLATAFTALGMIVGFWCGSNKTSLFVSLCLYLLFLLPTTLLAHAQAGYMGLLMQQVNPLGAPRVFLSSMLVNNWTLDRAAPWLIAPAVFAITVLVMLFYKSPRLRLEPGLARMPWARSRVAAAALIACMTGFVGAPAASAQANEPQAAEPTGLQVTPEITRAPLDIWLDRSDTLMRAGGSVLFNTVVRNKSGKPSGPIILAMNIIRLNTKGDVVDPEDWSPQRNQYIEEGLAPGDSSTHAWRVNAILDGDFMVYMVAMAAPPNATTSTQPVASPGIHLTVTPFTKLNPGGVLPYAVGGPVLLGLLMTVVYRRRRRQIDMGG